MLKMTTIFSNTMRGLVLLLCAAPVIASAATYSYAPTAFNWIDPSTHTNVTWTNTAGCTGGGAPVDDDITAPINLGFTFNFGGVNYTQVQVMSNGRLQFNNTFCGFGTQTVGPPRTYPYGIPDTNMVRTMKVYGADLDPLEGGTVRYAALGAAPNRTFVVTWTNVPEWNSPAWTCAQSCFNLQAILYENGDFVYQYGLILNPSLGHADVGWELTTSDYGLVSYVTATGLLNSAYRFYIPPPYAEYRMEEASWNGTAGEVVDSSGNGHNGTAVGNAQTTASGYICRGANIPLNTSGATIDAIDTGIVVDSGIGASGTIDFWYKGTAAWNDGNNRMLLDGTSNNGSPFFLSKRGNGQLRFVLNDGNGTVWVNQGTTHNYAAGTWHHIAITWSEPQSRMIIYVDGVLDKQANVGISNGLDNNGATLYIGDNQGVVTSYASTGNSANGIIDEARIYNYEAPASVISRDYLLPPRSCSTLNHFAISNSGTGVNCQAEPVTITAHDVLHNPVVTSVSVGITTSTNHGDWTLQTGAGTLVNSGNGAATYTFNNESSIVLLLKDTFPETTNINLNAGGITEAATEDPSLTFAPSGFRFLDAAYNPTIANQIAGVTSATYYLQAIRTDTNTGACVGVFNNQTVNIDLASQCNNPTTCAGSQVSFNGSPIASNPNSGVSSYTTLPVTFLNDSTSRAAFTFVYPDVGQISLDARYNIPRPGGSGSGNFMLGSSNAFIVKPYAFTVTAIQRTADGFANPGAASVTGPVFIKAGDPFTATVTATAFGGAATPNFGKEIIPEGVLLTPNLVLPAGGINPALGNGTIAGGLFSSGVATVTNLSWGDVGIITLTPSIADGDYLGAGNVTGTATGNVGRFYPHHFVASGVLTPRADLACAPASTFTYMGEPMALVLTLTAQNAANGTTQNYTTASGFAKLDGTTVSKWTAFAINDSIGLGAVSGGSALSSRISVSGAPSGNWVTGVGTLIANVALNRAATVDGPFSLPINPLKIGVAPQDQDAVQLLPGALNLDADLNSVNERQQVATADIRYGRIRLNNAIGSEILNLPVPVKAQYFNGMGFVNNSDDNCTAFSLTPVTNGSPTNFQYGSLLIDNPKKSMTVGASTLGGASSLIFSGGVGATFPPTLGLILFAPNLSGSIDLTLTVPAWLQFNWTGVVGNPKARATFGAYRNTDQFIYQRENY